MLIVLYPLVGLGSHWTQSGSSQRHDGGRVSDSEAGEVQGPWSQVIVTCTEAAH